MTRRKRGEESRCTRKEKEVTKMWHEGEGVERGAKRKTRGWKREGSRKVVKAEEGQKRVKEKKEECL